MWGNPKKTFILYEMSVYYCDEALGTFTIDTCPDVNGRIRGFILLACDAYAAFADFTAIGEWNTYLASGDAVRFQVASGTLSQGSPSTIPGHGDINEQFISAEYSGTINLRGLTSANRDFMNALNKSQKWQGCFLVGDRNGSDPKQIISTVPIDWYFSPVVDEGLDTMVEWQGTFKWRSPDLPLVKDVPSGLYS